MTIFVSSSSDTRGDLHVHHTCIFVLSLRSYHAFSRIAKTALQCREMPEQFVCCFKAADRDRLAWIQKLVESFVSVSAMHFE